MHGTPSLVKATELLLRLVVAPTHKAKRPQLFMLPQLDTNKNRVRREFRKSLAR